MILFIVWLWLSFIIGFFGTDKKIGYWGAFTVSLFLSPIIGLLVVLYSNSKTNQAHLHIQNFHLAQRNESQGNKNEAIFYYKQTLIEIKKLPLEKDKVILYSREKLRAEATQKIKELT
jgi:hypothetical protein